MAVVQAPVPTSTIKSTQLKGSLPNATIDATVDVTAIATKCIGQLEHLNEDVLRQDALWKDTLSLTGHQRTFHTSASILSAWKTLVPKTKPHNFALIPHAAQIMNLGPTTAWITAMFTFETSGPQAAKCSGSVNIVPSPDSSSDGITYKIWSFSTMLESLFVSQNPDTPPDPTFDPTANIQDGEIDVVIVGGGMAGLCVAGRLHSLKIPYVVIERNDTIGGNWTSRYDSVKLHLSNSYSEMPFQRVYSQKPYYLTKEDLAEGMQEFVRMHGLKVWLESSVGVAEWQDESGSWDVQISRQGKVERLRAKHIVMAIGSGVDKPFIPEYADRQKYKGEVIHTCEWKNGEALKGKTGVIVGSGNSAFDIAQDMVDAELSSITMLQRGITHVLPAEHVRASQDQLYNPNMDLGIADRIAQSSPYAIGRLIVIAGEEAMQAKNPHRYDFLKNSGFRYHEDPDLYAEALERLGGHYLDIGGLSLIKDGKVKVISGISPTEYTENGLRLADGTEIQTDVIVFATGYRNNLRQSTAEIVGSDTAAQLDEYWGLDPEGEIRGLAKPVGHPGIWYFGGGTANARFVSRTLALQIQADVLGVPFEPYVETP